MIRNGDGKIDWVAIFTLLAMLLIAATPGLFGLYVKAETSLTREKADQIYVLRGEDIAKHEAICQRLDSFQIQLNRIEDKIDRKSR